MQLFEISSSLYLNEETWSLCSTSTQQTHTLGKCYFFMEFSNSTVSGYRNYRISSGGTQRLILFSNFILYCLFKIVSKRARFLVVCGCIIGLVMCRLKVGCEIPGKYRICLDSDAAEFGGHARVDHAVDHFTSPEGEPGKPETNYNGRPHSFMVMAPSRSCQVCNINALSLHHTSPITVTWLLLGSCKHKLFTFYEICGTAKIIFSFYTPVFLNWETKSIFALISLQVYYKVLEPELEPKLEKLDLEKLNLENSH